ncbi:MAG: hypothetical protein WCY88_04105 [Spongiibacteraceae bacterium]
MKIKLAGLLLLCPLLSFAQAQTVQDPDAMMKKLQEMQTCMGAIDQTELKQLEQQSKQLQADISKLCNSGKADAAQNKALGFAKTVKNSKALKQLSNCTEVMAGIIPVDAYSKMIDSYSDEDLNVCSQIR